MRWICLLLPVALTAAAPVPSRPPQEQAEAPRTCFWPSEVTSFSSGGADLARVHISRRETWELTLARGCPNVDWAQEIAIRPRGGDRVCTGRPAELIVPDASGRSARNCLVTGIRLLSSEEAAAAVGLGAKP